MGRQYLNPPTLDGLTAQIQVGTAGQADRVVQDNPAFVARAAVGVDVVRRQIELQGVQFHGRTVLVRRLEMLTAPHVEACHSL